MKYDVVIVGGGMVGTALAVALKNSSLQVALIDSTPLLTDDARLIGLNYASFCFLKKLNIWPALESFATRIESIHVSHRGHFGTTRITAKEAGLDVLGYLVPAENINSALNNALNNIELIRPATVKTLSHTVNGATLTIEMGGNIKTIDATFVIGADGTQSTIRQLLGIHADIIDYHQSALVTVTELQRGHHNIAYERFQEAGAIAMLPFGESRAATIWTAANEMISDLLKLDDDAFLKELQNKFGYRLGRLIKTGKRAIYPLKKVVAAQSKQKNILLIGNAAHTFHPIASQGLNLALYEISLLADYLIQKPTSLDQLIIDEKQQKFSTQLSHQLTNLFSKDFFMLPTARAIGMIGFDILPAAKQFFIRQAIGNACKD
jgi:2-octaprenyl-6-methoxyphenol hydroxylase